MSWSAHEDPARAEALRALAESGRHLSTAMILFHTNLSRRVGLGPTEEKVLELARRHGDPSVGDLAAATGMAKNSISDVLDRLEGKGFIVRRPHPSDGRKLAITATEAGERSIGRLFAGLMAGLNELNDDYSTEELALIARYQRRAAQIQAAEAAALAEGEG